jgi:hypothetical protein
MTWRNAPRNLYGGASSCSKTNRSFEGLREIPEFIRLANTAPDLRRVHSRRQHFLAIGAGQNHSHIRPTLRGFNNDFITGAPGMVMSSRIPSILRPFARRSSMAADPAKPVLRSILLTIFRDRRSPAWVTRPVVRRITPSRSPIASDAFVTRFITICRMCGTGPGWSVCAEATWAG